MDRIGIHVEVPLVNSEKLSGQTLAETSAVVRARVEAARQRHLERFRSTALFANADMGPKGVREYCWLDEAGTP